MSDDLHAKATAAAARIATMNPAELLAQSLATDRPTIESAIKSFLSLSAARSIAQTQPKTQTKENVSKRLTRCRFSSEDPRLSALKCARTMLRELDNFQLSLPESEGEETKKPVTEENLEYEVVRTIWNGLIASEKKPSRFLGRISLLHVYPKIIEKMRNEEIHVDNVPKEEAMAFFEEFGVLLERREAGKDEDDDAALLWDNDRGAAELTRRRDRREKNKKEKTVNQNDDIENTAENSEGPTIELIEDENNENSK